MRIVDFSSGLFLGAALACLVNMEYKNHLYSLDPMLDKQLFWNEQVAKVTTKNPQLKKSLSLVWNFPPNYKEKYLNFRYESTKMSNLKDQRF